jgi:hypothetical protein
MSLWEPWSVFVDRSVGLCNGDLLAVLGFPHLWCTDLLSFSGGWLNVVA